MADVPGVTIEVAWSTDPLHRPTDHDTLVTEDGDALITEGGDTLLVSDGVWTDITPDNPARGELSTARGVDMKLGTFETGVMNLTLDNVNGDLDPSNVSGTYYPNVKPRKRIRASVTPEGGTKTPIFTGFVERWPIRWRAEDELVDVTASDLFGVIAEEILPPSVVHYVTVGSDPMHYWPMNESGQFYIADDVVGTADGRWFSPAQGDVESVAAFDVSPGNVFNAASTDGQTPRQHVYATASVPFLYKGGIWYQLKESGTAAKSAVYGWRIVSASRSESLIVTPETGQIELLLTETGTNSLSHIWQQPTLGDGHRHHIYIDTDAVPTLYFDGELDDGLTVVANGSSPIATAGELPNSRVTIGEAVDATATAPWRHAFGHLAFWGPAATPDYAAIYDAGSNAWDGDSTDQRLTRILDIVGVDAGDRDIEAGTQICGPALLNSENVVSYIRKIAATENSALFCSADGKVTFRANDNDPAATLEFGEDTTGGEVPYIELVPDYPVERIINYAEVNRDGGNVQRHEDATSRTENGTVSVQVETLHQTPSGARSLAAGMVARNKTPKTTITRLTVDGRDDDVTAAASLTLDIGDAVDARLAPPHVDIFIRDGAGEIILDGSGNPLTTAGGIGRYFVERVEQRLSEDTSWHVTYGLAEVAALPAFAWDTADQGYDQAVWS